MISDFYLENLTRFPGHREHRGAGVPSLPEEFDPFGATL